MTKTGKAKVSSSCPIKYRYGITGFVELQNDTATKYSEFDQMYWLKELAVLLHIWPYRTDNIIKYQSGRVIQKECPNDKHLKKYYESTFIRYKRTLQETHFYRDTEIIQFMLDMTSALSFLHRKNIVHRDIKPVNIMLTKTGRTILLDFSHAHKMYTPLNKLDKYVVTYCYRAPEVFEYQKKRGTLYTNKIDVFSLGIVLLDILTHCNFAEYYISEVKSEDNMVDEKIYRNLIKDEGAFMSHLEVYFNENKKKFKYLDTYWGWITSMIAYAPENRISAAAMYEKVLAFAIDNDIEFVEPINGLLERQMPDLQMPNLEIHYPLYQKCIAYAEEIKHKNYMVFDLKDIYALIALMLTKKDINIINYRTFIGAVCIIFETVVYDNHSEMDTYGELDNDVVKDTIVYILQKYNQHLFGINRIFYYGEKDLEGYDECGAESNTEEIDDTIHIKYLKSDGSSDGNVMTQQDIEQSIKGPIEPPYCNTVEMDDTLEQIVVRC